MTEPAPTPFSMELPDELAAGAYSNVVGVWHTPYEFTLDFGVLLPGPVMVAEGDQTVQVIPARIVSRIKIPPAVVFELMRALSQNETLYETNFGPIPRPGRPDEEPPLYPPDSAEPQ